MKEEHMANAHMLSIDLAKRSFQVCATNRAGSCVDASQIARRFLILLGRALYRSCVRSLVWLADAMGRYAVRTIGATSVQRAGSLSPRGLVSRIVNIEFLAPVELRWP